MTQEVFVTWELLNGDIAGRWVLPDPVCNHAGTLDYVRQLAADPGVSQVYVARYVAFPVRVAA